MIKKPPFFIGSLPRISRKKLYTHRLCMGVKEKTFYFTTTDTSAREKNCRYFSLLLELQTFSAFKNEICTSIFAYAGLLERVESIFFFKSSSARLYSKIIEYKAFQHLVSILLPTSPINIFSMHFATYLIKKRKKYTWNLESQYYATLPWPYIVYT